MTATALVALVLAAAALPTAAADSGKIFLSMAQMKALTIDPVSFSLGVVSKDGNTALCVEKIRDPRRKARGEVWKLQVFHLDWTAQKPTLETILLPTSQIEQLAVSPDGKWALGIAEFGTRFISVDVANKKARVLFRNEKGKPGFRSQPEVAWFENGKFHTLGYFYDDTQTVTEDVVAAIDVTGNGLEAIQKVRNINKLHARTAGFAVQEWYHSDQSWFGMVWPDKKMHLMAAVGDELQPVEVALGYGGIAVGQDRVIYAARFDKKTFGVYIYDLATRKKTQLGDPSRLYNYLYMSEDGNTVLVTWFDTAKRLMTTWYGRESEHYALHPVPGIDRAKPGTIRFSPGGEVAAFYNPDGVLFTRLPGGR